MIRTPWKVVEDWGGGYSIRARDSEGEWLIATAKKCEGLILMVEAVNAFTTGRPPAGDWIAAASTLWVVETDDGDRFAVWPKAAERPAWPLARFNRREDIALLVRAVKRARKLNGCSGAAIQNHKHR